MIKWKETAIPLAERFPTQPTTATWSCYRRFMLGAILLALGAALVFPPKHLEGRTILPLIKGHGITVSDLFALLFLIPGAGLIAHVLWRLRSQLAKRIEAALMVGGGEIFIAGMAVGILANTVIKSLDWQWSPMLLWLVLAGALIMALFSASGRRTR
jgi:dipeptide/tripeptide permease